MGGGKKNGKELNEEERKREKREREGGLKKGKKLDKERGKRMETDDKRLREMETGMAGGSKKK